MSIIYHVPMGESYERSLFAAYLKNSHYHAAALSISFLIFNTIAAVFTNGPKPWFKNVIFERSTQLSYNQ